MIKATGNEHCSRCGLTVSKGEDLMEGSAVTDDAGCLYHPDCYSALCQEESARDEHHEAQRKNPAVGRYRRKI